MSHVEPHEPSDAPATPPASHDTPPPSPPATEPPSAPETGKDRDRVNDDDEGKGSDRIGALESIVSNLADAVGSLTDALANGVEREKQPQKLPWTHRGGRRNV